MTRDERLAAHLEQMEQRALEQRLEWPLLDRVTLWNRLLSLGFKPEEIVTKIGPRPTYGCHGYT